MKKPLVNVGTLMIVVAAAALDLVAGRALLDRNESYGYNVGMLLSLAPMAVALQAALLCAMTTRGSRRIFWVGFTVSAITTLSMVVAAYEDPPCETTTLATVVDGQFSTAGRKTTQYPGCIAARILFGYESLFSEWFDRFGYRPMSPAKMAFVACSELIPHLILACGAGFVSLALSQRGVTKGRREFQWEWN